MIPRLFSSLAVFLLSGFLLCPSSPAAPAPRAHGKEAKAAGLKPEVLRELDAAMQRQVNEGQISGVLAMVYRHGTMGYDESFGYRAIGRQAPMDHQTLFRIYSMTKPITAVTAMCLWEEGKFQLDDPISNYLPEWKNTTVREKGNQVVPARTPVTPRILMTHSTGYSYEKRDLALGDNDSLEAFSKSLAARPLLFHPGTDYRYGYSIDILGRYIEAIEGKSLDEVMQERIFDKLGMKDTAFWLNNPRELSRVALVYTRGKEGDLVPAMRTVDLLKKPARMMGGQGLLSTADDYLLFCRMLLAGGELNGARVLKRETVDLFFQDHLKDIPQVYGLGGTVDEKGLYAWGGAAGTGFWVNRSTDSCAVFMIQRWQYKVDTYEVFKDLVGKAME